MAPIVLAHSWRVLERVSPALLAAMPEPCVGGITGWNADACSACSAAEGWAQLPRDALAAVLLCLHPSDCPLASLVCKSWLQCHDELVTVLAHPQPVEVCTPRRAALPCSNMQAVPVTLRGTLHALPVLNARRAQTRLLTATSEA